MKKLSTRTISLLAAAGLLAGIGLVNTNAFAATATPPFTVNFVSDSHGFDTIVEGDAYFSGNESEGAAAVGGDVRFNNFRWGVGQAQDLGSIPGDARVGLLSGGTLVLGDSSGTMMINNGGHVYLENAAGLQMQADGTNRAITVSGASINSTPRVFVNGGNQAINSLQAPGVFNDLFDGALDRFKRLNTCLATQSTTAGLKLHDIDNSDKVIPPGGSLAGKKIRVELDPSVSQNIWTLSVSELNSIAEISFFGGVNPSASSPLVINVTGNGTLQPNNVLVNGDKRAGLAGLLWNLGTNVTLQTNSLMQGTFFAPNGSLKVNITNNIEGQIIARSLNIANIGEQHHYPFLGTLTCGTDTPPSPTPTGSTTPTSTPSPTVTPTGTPSPTASPTGTPKPTASPTGTPKPTASPTSTPTPTTSPTRTPTPTATPTGTPSPTASPTGTPSPTHSPLPAASASSSATPVPIPPKGGLANTGMDGGVLGLSAMAGILLLAGGFNVWRSTRRTRRTPSNN